MSEEPTLLVERDGPTVVLTMNRPERRNTLTLDMIVRLADAWDQVDGDDSIRCAILTGAGDVATAPAATCPTAGWAATSADEHRATEGRG